MPYADSAVTRWDPCELISSIYVATGTPFPEKTLQGAGSRCREGRRGPGANRGT